MDKRTPGNPEHPRFILESRAKRASFISIEQLKQCLLDFIAYFNQTFA